jgi:nucleoside phosphorylase
MMRTPSLSGPRLVVACIATLVALQLAAMVPAIAASVAPASPAHQSPPAHQSSPARCTPRLLVLGSMPSEIGMFIAAAKLQPDQPVTRSGRHFFVGRLEGRDVIIGMVGTGLVNAHEMMEAALNGFSCISAVVYAGVAGGGQGSQIGDVTVAGRWTLDNGKSWMPTNPKMLATARAVVPTVHLERTTPLGSPGCLCQPDAVKTVTLTHVPRVIIGGNAQSYDTFGGKAFPCVPGGGDIFGCEPCAFDPSSASDAGRSVTAAVSFATLQEFESNFGPAASPSETGYEASDNETASADEVAVHHNLPFIAFRAISDGSPDPLMLPGYPSQFFVYYQLAAENAQIAALAFIGQSTSAW